jgi:hypothetical protein
VGSDAPRARAVEIARGAAKAKPQSYYAEPFEPHEWVVDAIVAAGTEARAEIVNLRGELGEARAELERHRFSIAKLTPTESERNVIRWIREQLRESTDYDIRRDVGIELCDRLLSLPRAP